MDGQKFVIEIGLLLSFFKRFYSSKGMSKGIEIIIPNETEQDLIHSIYMNELVFNINNQDSKIKLIEIIFFGNKMVINMMEYSFSPYFLSRL